MAQLEIDCPKCKSGEYILVNARTGEVRCPFCRNQWIAVALSSNRNNTSTVIKQTTLPDERPSIKKITISPERKREMELASGFRFDETSFVDDMAPNESISDGGVMLIALGLLIAAAFITLVIALAIYNQYFGTTIN